MYKKYIKYNYYRFINGNVKVNINLQGKELNTIILNFIFSLSSDYFWNYNYMNEDRRKYR